MNLKIPKNYFHDKSILGLLSANGALLLVTIATVLFNVDTENNVSIVSYRQSRAIQISGPTSDLYQFALFAIIVTFVSVALSLRFYTHRRHLSVSMIALNMVTLLLCLVIFNALTRTL